MTYRPEIAAEVLAEMGRQKMTKTELARRTGIYRSRLNRVFIDGLPFDTDELAVVAAALDTTVSELYGRAEVAA